jgi:hypothetical protein
MSNPSNYYIARKMRFLMEFDLVARSARSMLNKYFVGKNVNGLLAETHREFEALIPQLSYIGGKQPFCAPSNPAGGRWSSTSLLPKEADFLYSAER